MVEVEIPNNISEYKPKLFLGLTGRQVVSVVIAAAFIGLDLKFLAPYVGDFFAMCIAAVPALIATLFGFIPFYGMPFEKYLKSVLFQAVLAPKTRKAKTVSPMVVPCDKNYVPIPDSALSPEVLECVQYVREKTGIGVDENETSNKRKKKAKYRQSKQAML